MKKYTIILIIFLLHIFAVNSENLSKERIEQIGLVTIDMYEVTSKAQVYQDIIKQIENKSAELNKKAQEKGEQLEKEFAELKKLKSTLSEKAYNKKTEEFAVREAEIRRSLSIEQNKIINAKEQSFHEVNKTTEKILENMSKEYKFEVVLPTENTLFDTEKVDITYEVIKRLNNESTNYKVKFD